MKRSCLILLVWLLPACLAFSQDRAGRIRLIEVENTGSADGLIDRFIKPDRATHWADILALSFHPNGKLIATGGVDQSVRVWNAETLRQIDSIEHLGGIVSHVKFVADDRIVVILRDARDQEVFGYSSSKLVILSLTDGRLAEQSRLTGFVRNIQSAVVTPDSNRLILDDGMQAIHVYDIQGDHPIWIQVLVFPSQILSGSVSEPLPRERESFTGTGPAVVINGGRGIPMQGRPPLVVGAPSHRSGERPLALAMSKDGTILVGVTDKKIRAWTVAERCEPIAETDGTGAAAVITPDNQYVVVAQNSGGLDVWPLLEKEFAAEPEHFELGIKNLTSLDISGDGKHLAIGQYQGQVTGVIELNDGIVGKSPIELVDPKVDDALRLANQEMHWVEANHNRRPHRVPVAFHPTSNQVATVRHRRFLQVSRIKPNTDAPPFETFPGDRIALWHSSDRRIRCLSDNKTLFVTTPNGAITINAETGALGDEIRSHGHPAIAMDGSIAWTFDSIAGGGFRPAINQMGTKKNRSFEIDWIGRSEFGDVVINHDARLLATLRADQQQIRIFHAQGGRTTTLPISDPPVRIIGFSSKKQLLISSIGKSDFGGTLHQVMEYDLSGEAQPVAKKRAEVRAADPKKDRFIVSRDGDAVVFQEVGGRYRLLSDSSSRRSRRAADPIECVSHDGEFLVTLLSFDLGNSIVSVIRSATGQTIQRWRFPGVVTDLDLSADETFIATVNADGSIGRFDLLDRANWPEESNDDQDAPSSSVEDDAESELQQLMDQAADEIKAYQDRIAKANGEDETLETMCSEPYSSIIVRLANLSLKYPGTDIEFTALHRAIGMKRVTPRHVPGASWTKKRNQWYAISKSADDRLKKIARLDFADRFIDDPRTASILRQVIEYWRTRQNTDVMKAAMELYQRSGDRSVQAAALLLYAEANTGEQVQFLMSGHRITQPTADQLQKARDTLRKIQKEYAGVQVEGIGDVAQRAAELLRPTGVTE